MIHNQRFEECLICIWWRRTLKIPRCIFGTCIFTEAERKSGIIKYNYVERRFYEFLKGADLEINGNK